MLEHITPKISRTHAKDILCSPPGFLKRKRHLEKIDLFYLPSYIVTINVSANGTSQSQTFCIDAVLGSFAFFDSATETELSSHLKTCPFFLNVVAVQDKAIDEYRRHLLRTGLKMRYKFKVESIADTRPIYYPFWIGYFKQKENINFDAIDAVGGEHQGAAMRPVFIKALLNEVEKSPH